MTASSNVYALRTHRSLFREKIAEFDKQIAALSTRDLHEDARRDERHRLETERRNVYDKFRHTAEKWVAAADREAGELQPHVRRLRAAYKNPRRAADMADLASRANDGQLAALAMMAREEADHAAMHGVVSALGVREQVDAAAAELVRRAASAPDPEHALTLAAAVVLRAELAGIDSDAAIAGIIEPTRALATAHAAGKDSAIAEAYHALGLTPKL